MTKKQHYVPRFLLKNFSDDQEAAWCLKKSNLKVFKTNIRNICCKSYLYETRWEHPVSNKEFVLSNDIEKRFSEKEKDYADLLRRIIEICKNKENQNALIFTSSEKEKMASFVSNLFCRNPKTMECYMQEIPNEEEIDEIQIFKDILQKLGIDDFSPFYEHAYKCGICNEDYSGTIAAEVKKTLINSKVHILKSSSEENFIIGSFPLLYEEIDLGKDSFVKNLFLPIHPKLGVLYTKKDNAFQKQSNKIIEISGSDVLKINSFFIKEEYAEYIISQKKEELQFFLDTQLI